MEQRQYLHINTVGNVTVGGAGSDTRLFAVVVGTGAASAVVTITDATSNATVATIGAASAGGYSFYGARIPGGMKVALAGGTADVTVVYA